MDAKITLSFDKEIISKAKAFADSQNISLSRLMEFLLKNVTTGQYKSLDELPVSEWVATLAEGETEYVTKRKSRSSLKKDFFDSRK